MAPLSGSPIALDAFRNHLEFLFPDLLQNKNLLQKVVKLTTCVIRSHVCPISGTNGFSYTTISFGVNSDGPDDVAYGADANLVKAVPRSFHLYGNIIDGVFTQFSNMGGALKMLVSNSEDDDDQCNLTTKQRGKGNANLRALQLPMKDIQKALDTGCLGVTDSFKENGKFGQASLTYVRVSPDDEEDTLMFMYSSKSIPSMCRFCDIGAYLHDENQENIGIAHAIMNKILRNFASSPAKDTLHKFYVPYLDTQKSSSIADEKIGRHIPSLCMEISDGQHISKQVVEDNKDKCIVFGAYLRGISVANAQHLSSLGFRTVQEKPVVSPDFSGKNNTQFKTSEELIEHIRVTLFCSPFEGSVTTIKIYNKSGELLPYGVFTVKVKAALYKLVRSTRQVITNNHNGGWWPIIRTSWGLPFVLADVFSEPSKAAYNRVNTNGVYRFICWVTDFAVWAMKNELPVSVLECAPIVSVRETMSENGTRNWIDKYIRETGAVDFAFTPEDMGVLNPNQLREQLNEKYPSRSLTDPINILCTFGISGTGKSVNCHEIIQDHTRNGMKAACAEQDRFRGCTRACRSWAAYLCSLPPSHPDAVDAVIISRINLNDNHYRRYFDACLNYNARIILVGPTMIQSHPSLYGMICAAHLLKRQRNGDFVMPNRQEMTPLKAVNIIRNDQFPTFSLHSQAICVDHHRQPLDTETSFIDAAHRAWSTGNAATIIDFINEGDNYSTLLSFDLDIGTISRKYSSLIMSPPRENIIVREKRDITYISAQVNQESNDLLDTVFSQHFTDEDIQKGRRVRQRHLTIVYFDKNTPKTMDQYPPSFENINLRVTHVVQRIHDGQIAWRVSECTREDSSVVFCPSMCPHLTELVANNSSAAESRQFCHSNNPESVKVIQLDNPLSLRSMCIFR